MPELPEVCRPEIEQHALNPNFIKVVVLNANLRGPITPIILGVCDGSY